MDNKQLTKKEKMTEETIRISEIVRADNREMSRDGMLAKVIDTNNEDAICIRFNDGHEEWRFFKDVKKVNN